VSDLFTFNPGEMVTLVELPPWVGKLPIESRRVYEHCVGRTYRIDEIDSNGLLVLDVREVDALFGGFMNDIRVEPRYVRSAADLR
jgi:hypothetical protein